MIKNIFKTTLIMLALISLSTKGFSQIVWETPTTYSSTATKLTGPYFKDLNNDGFKDIILHYQAQGKLAVFINNTDGTFTDKGIFNMDKAAWTSPVFADFNNDGFSDIAFANSDAGLEFGGPYDKVNVLLGNGDGTFQAFQSYTVNTWSYAVDAGDINNDGFIDLIVAFGGSGGFKTLINDGDGTFTVGDFYSSVSEVYPVNLVDLNGDTYPDACVSGSSVVDVFMGNGNGTFQTKVSYSSGGRITWADRTRYYDLDSDGDNDIYVSAADDNTYMLKNDGAGNLNKELLFTGYHISDVIMYNADAHPDVIVLERGTTNYWLFLNDGNGTFTERIQLTDWATRFADLNNDGILEAVKVNTTNQSLEVYFQEIPFSVETEADYAQLNNPVSIPVTATSELTTDDGIYSYQFVYNFDETKLQYVDYDLTGTIAEGGTVNINTSVAGQLTVSCMRATPITGQGDLIYFNFNAIAEGTSPLTVSNFKYNETDVTDVTNGDIQIVPVTVADVTYSTDVILPGTELEITIEFNNAITGTPQFELSGANTLSATDLVNVSGNTYTYTYTVQAGEGIVNLGVLGTDEYGFDVTYTPTIGATFEILSLTYGDVTDNGEITAYDAALALMYSVGVDPMPSITPLPWDLWRILTADVDGSNDITATDAGLILQYSVGLINIFPVENPAKSGNDKSGDISVEIVNNEFIFTTQDELVGFNLFVTNNSNIVLGEPQILDETMLSATQIENEIYNVGMCIAISPANGTQIMKIPFTGELTGQLTFDMKVNNSDKSVTFGTTGINEVADNGISIYPNPASETIQINTDMTLDKSTVEIYSITGSLIETKTLNSQSEINISNLPSGTYLMKINVDNKTLTEKFIKE